MRISATYYDGQSAAAHKIEIELIGHSLRLISYDTSRTVGPDEATLEPPIGSGTWNILLADGASVQFSDDRFGQSVADQFGHRRFLQRLESSWHWAALGVIVAVVGGWVLLTFAVPVIARSIAFSLPPEIDARMGEESIDLLDRLIFEESELDAGDRSRVAALFDEIIAENPDYGSYRLEFRASPTIGANAFAVPGGRVVMTDEMVRLAQTDAEIVAVLAHEVGHLSQRHSLRILLQNSASAVIIAGLTGDLSSVTALSATVPTVLMQAKYSRDFEREADAIAFRYLDTHGMETDALSRLLLRLEEEHGKDGVEGVSPWFSSHPRSEERLPER